MHLANKVGLRPTKKVFSLEFEKKMVKEQCSTISSIAREKNGLCQPYRIKLIAFLPIAYNNYRRQKPWAITNRYVTDNCVLFCRHWFHARLLLSQSFDPLSLTHTTNFSNTTHSQSRNVIRLHNFPRYVPYNIHASRDESISSFVLTQLFLPQN